jgi:hypothetical protein
MVCFQKKERFTQHIRGLMAKNFKKSAQRQPPCGAQQQQGGEFGSGHGSGCFAANYS